MQKQLSITLDEEVYEEVEAIRKRHGASRSRFINESLRATFPKLAQARGFAEILEGGALAKTITPAIPVNERMEQ